MSKNILILYITEISGHHKASMAIEEAIKLKDPSSNILSVNSFNYTNPILEKIINKTYTGIIKRTPEVWEYLYDNPQVVKNTQRLKDAIHKYNSKKLKSLIDSFKADVVIATQAFPCGIVADLKKTFKLNISLIAVLTDFCPHSYWMYESVDRYVVASDDAKQRFLTDGVPEEKIKIFGIPVNSEFQQKKSVHQIKENLGLEHDKPIVLVMGGGSGLGPIKAIASVVDKLNINIQMIIVTGTNKKLYKYMNKKLRKFNRKFVLYEYCDNIDELMEISDIVITKPGGITTSEALAKALPILIVNPIPGQEAKNSKFLVKSGAAVKAENQVELTALLENLFSMPSKLKAMSEAAKKISKPSSANDIADMVLDI